MISIKDYRSRSGSEYEPVRQGDNILPCLPNDVIRAFENIRDLDVNRMTLKDKLNFSNALQSLRTVLVSICIDPYIED